MKIPDGCFYAAALLLAVCFFSGCGPGCEKEETDAVKIPLVRLASRHYPEFRDDRGMDGLEAALANSLAYLKRVPADRLFVYGSDTYTAGHLIHSMDTFLAFVRLRPTAGALDEFIRKRFTVYRAAGNAEGQTLFTGYYEPTYPGSREKSGQYPFPVFSIPRDLVRINLGLFSDKYAGHSRLVGRVNASNEVVPYFSREEINGIQDFEDRAVPLVWLRSRVDRFFLEIQGSGRIRLENDEELRLHYAVSNGKAYASIGRYLIDNNEIPKEKMSMQAIREWLENHPGRMDEVLHHNDSFVFFQIEKGGPYGSLGVTVTPVRSIATDAKLFPKAGLCFVTSFLPAENRLDSPENWPPFSGFMLNQDTGGAIRGTARADIFCGNGTWAEFTAGHMNQYGRLYFLVLTPEQN